MKYFSIKRQRSGLTLLYTFLLLLLSSFSVFSQAIIDYSKTAVVKRLTDFGALPNDNIDDSQALKLACAWFANPTNINYATQYGKLIIPTGTFIVGKQKIYPNQTNAINYARPEFEANIENVNGFIIEGEPHAKIKLADGLLYGYFDPVTGNPVSAYPSENYKLAITGQILAIHTSAKNVIVQNIELDGNSDNYVIGGKQWNEFMSYQAASFGIYTLWGEFVTLKNLYIHKFAADGVYVSTKNDKTQDNNGQPRWNTLLDNVTSDSSGRNCITWSAGTRLKIINSKFRYAGLGKASSPPRVCLDVEAENTMDISVGLFENCTLKTSAGGIINIAGGEYPVQRTDSLKFVNCLIDNDLTSLSIGTNYSRSRSYTFDHCTVYGSIYMHRNNEANGQWSTYFPNSGKTIFKNCNINQGGMQNVKSFGSLAMINDLCLFDSCTFNTNGASFFGVAPVTNGVIAPADYSIARNCTFYTNKDVNTDATDWGYMQFLRFEGINNFLLTSNSVNQSSHSRRHFFNSLIAGSRDPLNRDQFVTDKYFFTQQYEGTRLTIGADECSYADFIITDRSIYDNFKKEVIINRNSRIIVKAGGTLMFREATVRLYGQIIVEPGGFFYIDNGTNIYTCSGNNMNNIVMNGTYGVGIGLWNPGNLKSNPLAITGSLSGCVACASETPACMNLGEYQCSGNAFEIKSYTLNASSSGTYSVKLTYMAYEKPSLVKVRINGGVWQTIALPQTAVGEYLSKILGNFGLNAGANTIDLVTADGYMCFKELCSQVSSGARLAAPSIEPSSRSLSVYPNPSSGKFQVSFYLPLGEKATLSVTDLQGKVWVEKKVTGHGVHQEPVELEQAAGTYVIGLKQATGIQTQKIVIVR